MPACDLAPHCLPSCCCCSGVRVCGVCFGTGLRNVRGLLRRPEATALVQKMQHGELRPGAGRVYWVSGGVQKTLHAAAPL